jgi:predicted transcriptional regulator
MKTYRFADLKHKSSPARRAEIARAAKQELRDEDDAFEMSLRAVREMAGKTQAEVAAALKMAQGHVSTFESRDDRRVSNLRRYIKALGGELRMVARFGRKEVRLDV